MTNKMPVVGQKYLSTKTGLECKLIFWDERTAIAKCKYGTRLECIGEKFWDYFEELPEDNIKIQPKPVVDNKIETNNEVDRALEELKREINYLENKGIIDFEAYLKLRTRSQNLVDALEAEESAMNVVKDALKEGIRNMKDFNAKMDEKYPMSKPEPKIDMKEERKEVNEVDKAYDKGWHDGVDFAKKILIEELKRK